MGRPRNSVNGVPTFAIEGAPCPKGHTLRSPAGKCITCRKEYYEKNKDARLEYARAYRQKTKKRRLKYSRGHIGIISRYKSVGKRRGYTWQLTDEQAIALLDSDCHYCGGKGGGIDRVDNTLGYESGNCVAACGTCNVAKSDMSANQFTQWVERVYSHLHSK